MIKDFLELLSYFIKTEVISAVELLLWVTVKNTDFYLMLWNTDYVKPAMALGLLSIPLISLIQEYNNKKREISNILKKIKFSRPHRYLRN